MSEIYVELTPHHPIDIFGVEEEKLNRIRRYFPYLNIVLRGDLLKAIGDPAHLADFEAKLKLLLFHFDRFNRLVHVIEDSAYAFNQHDLGHVVPVLVEGTSKKDEAKLLGKSPKNQTVHAPLPVGVRIEDLTLVTEDGVEILNHLPKALEVLP